MPDLFGIGKDETRENSAPSNPWKRIDELLATNAKLREALEAAVKRCGQPLCGRTNGRTTNHCAHCRQALSLLDTEAPDA